MAIVLPTEKSKIKSEIKNIKTFMYGEPKVGKSTAYSKLEDTLYIATERGHNFLEVYKVDVFTWEDALEVLELLKKENKYKAVVIDIVDKFYQLCSDYVCKLKNMDHPSDEGFGKGWSAVTNEFFKYINSLESLGLSVHFIGHCKEKEQKSKVQTWTVMSPSLSDSIQRVITGFVDFIFYAYIDKDGKPVMRTKANKHIIAGGRSGNLPEIMPLDLLEVEALLNGNNDTATSAD